VAAEGSASKASGMGIPIDGGLLLRDLIDPYLITDERGGFFLGGTGVLGL